VEQKKVVYISGPITGVARYWEAFEQAEEDLQSLGYIPLSPAHLPEGLTNEQYTRIDLAMIDSADAVLCLVGYSQSRGASLEYRYCQYIGKPTVCQRTHNAGGGALPRAFVQDLIKKDLEEVLNA
jgi:nucleoside 2-deoxyribosyltransferase